MDRQRWTHIDEVFQGALELNAEEREAYLERACAGDADLRARVERLLELDRQSSSLLERPVSELAADVGALEPELRAGEHLGDYEMLGLLGAGGMGDVYLARDARLGRQVALKRLPAAFAADPQRLQRFRTEARAASALNHPNIVTVYEIGSSDGLQFIATEFIEGETLRERLRSGRLAVGEAVDVAIQMASALEVAHTAGIVHRDIKPENVMVRRDGIVKLLDFGIAKLDEDDLEEVGSGDERSTLRHTATQAGTVMGTVSYMSPEQARGDVVDARTDVWSLGVVLYEMVAGRAPFTGATTAELRAAILESEPEALDRVEPEAPADLERIVATALRKDAVERYQSIGELLDDLRLLKFGLTSVPAPTLVTAQPSNRLLARAARLIGRHTATAGVAVFVLACIAGLVAFRMRSAGDRATSGRGSASRFDQVEPRRLVANEKIFATSISPDGKYVAYVVDEDEHRSMWLREVTSATGAQIVPPTGDRWYAGLTISPDDQFLYYVEVLDIVGTGSWVGDAGANGRLFRVPLRGGTPTQLYEHVGSNVSFSPDGRQFAVVQCGEDHGSLTIAEADGSGDRELCTYRDGEYGTYLYQAAAWSPDGKVVVTCTNGLTPESRFSRFVAVDVSTGTVIPVACDRVFEYIAAASWLPDGSGLIVAAEARPRQLWRVDYPSGTTKRITNDSSQYSSSSMTADGSALVVVRETATTNIWIAPAGDPDRARRLTTGTGTGDGSQGLAWTPDGRIVYSSQPGDNLDLWIVDVDGSNARRLTFDDANDCFPTISGDGRYVVYSSGFHPHLWRVPLDGGDPVQLTTGAAEGAARSSPYSRWLAYAAWSDAGSYTQSFWKMPVEGGEPVRLVDESIPDSWWCVTFSPDGRYVAASPPTSGETVIIPMVSGSRERHLPSLGNAFRLDGWTADGRALVYVDAVAGAAGNVWLRSLNGGPPTQLTHLKSDGIYHATWSPDGSQLAYSRGEIAKDLILMSAAR